MTNKSRLKTILPRYVVCSLWINALYTAICAGLLAFPGGFVSDVFGVPHSAHSVYRVLVFVLLMAFSLTYGWCAKSGFVSRPYLGIAATAKATIFFLFSMLFFFGEISPVLYYLSFGELISAIIWFYWLLKNSK